jgi:hypothetical protein
LRYAREDASARWCALYGEALFVVRIVGPAQAHRARLGCRSESPDGALIIDVSAFAVMGTVAEPVHRDCR